jgi:tripartite ATP-independent transporter DctP family solute receptor
MKRLLSVVLVVLMAFLAIGFSQNALAATKLIYIHGSSTTSILQLTALNFKALIEARTNGRYTVEIHPNFELGSLTESVEMIKSGEVALSGVTLGSYYTPKLSFVDLPNAVPSIDAAYRLYAESSFRDKISEILGSTGIKLLSFGAAYFREMTSNKPVNTIEDIKGIKIRTMENPIHMAYWTSLGARPTPLAWAETYIGLQQGLVDAQENPYDSINAAKLYEVQKYVINTHHILYSSPVLVNQKFFDKLSAEDQKIFIQAGKDTEKYTYETASSNVAALRKTLEGKGMKVIDLSPETLNKMREMASSVYDTVRKTIGDDVMDAFLAALKTAGK